MSRGLFGLAGLLVVTLVSGCAARQTDEGLAAYPSGAPGSGAVYQEGKASYYSDRLEGRPTAGGEPYDPSALTAAHRTLPFGTMVEVARSDGRRVTVRINDRGPFAKGRIIDLSKQAALAIGLVRDGVAEVVLRVLSVPPARARRR